MSRKAILLALPLLFLAGKPAEAQPLAVSAFRSVQLSGGGELVIRRGAAQQVTLVAGSSDVTRFRVRNGRLEIDACNGRCPSRYRLRIEIVSPDVPDVAINGGGSIAIGEGFRSQDELSAAVRGGGQIDARAVRAANVSAAIQGGGLIRVNAERSLNTAINGGGEVRYVGNPQRNVAINGGGNLRRER